MRARRRFHGYCPPAARRTTNAVMFGAPDDYTSNLSGMTVQVMNALPIPDITFVQEPLCSIPSMDEDDDSSVAEIIQSVVMGIRVKKNKFQNIANGVVTSLSYDNRDGTSHHRPPTSKATLILLPNEDDDVRDASCDLNSNVMAHVEIVTPESGSVASVVSLENTNDGSDYPHNHERKGSFLAFRVNYLIVTTAIMLADGLQGKVDSRKFSLKLVERQLTQTLQYHACLNRDASLCSVRRLRILCCISVLFGVCYWGRNFPHYWTARGSTWSEESCSSLLRPRNWNQYAGTISNSGWFDLESHGWWNYNESLIIGLRNMARY